MTPAELQRLISDLENHIREMQKTAGREEIEAKRLEKEASGMDRGMASKMAALSAASTVPAAGSMINSLRNKFRRQKEAKLNEANKLEKNSDWIENDTAKAESILNELKQGFSRLSELEQHINYWTEQAKSIINRQYR